MSPETGCWSHCLDFFLRVRVGQMPDFERMGTAAYGRWQEKQSGLANGWSRPEPPRLLLRVVMSHKVAPAAQPWSFGLKHESGKRMPSEDTWQIATAEGDGKTLIFRIREHPPSFAQKESFPHLLAICWRYEPFNESGMPPQDAIDRMSQLENLLMPALEGVQAAFLTVIVTGNGVREW
jgi:hypothetical protein